MLYKFFDLLERPELTGFADFKEQRQSLKMLSYFYVTTFYFRAVLYGCLGSYKTIFGNTPEYVLYELFLVVSTILELPNLFFMYSSHFKSFREEKSPEAEEIDVDRYSASEITIDDTVETVRKNQPILVAITKLDANFRQQYQQRQQNESSVEVEDVY